MVGLYAEDLAASNNWVISGKLTADGKPILANDPHLQATAPGIWYLTELTDSANACCRSDLSRRAGNRARS